MPNFIDVNPGIGALNSHCQIKYIVGNEIIVLNNEQLKYLDFNKTGKLLIVSVSEMELGRQNRVGYTIIEILEPNTNVFASRIIESLAVKRGRFI